MKMLLPLRFIILGSSIFAPAFSKPHNAVLLSDIKSLTLRDGKMTSHRRTPAIPQLKCVGGSAQGLYTPDVMRCTNSGSSYTSADVEWTCVASLPAEFKLGSTDVVCEGYSGPDDEYVLKGSCGVEYRLILTESGQDKFSKRQKRNKSNVEDRESTGQAATFFWIIFLAVALFIVWGIFKEAFRGSARPRGPGGGGGGGSDDPPPPYSPYASPRTNRYPTSKAARASDSAGNTAWRPGFWTGAAAGTAAGYMAAQRASMGNANPEQQRNQARSSWFGNPAGEESSRRESTQSRVGNTFSHSNDSYSSTGFGTSRRR